MKRILLLAVTTAIVLVSSVSAQSGYELYQQALTKERVEGRLQEAIAIYQRIAKNFSSDRALAAKALLRLGECYQRLGDAQARKVYEQLVREYADKTDAVAVARSRLTAGDTSAAAAKGDRAVWTGSKVDLFGRVSPDGRYVSYVDWPGYGDLALHDVATNRDRLLTGKKNWEDLEGASASWSAISPDGKHIAYGWQSPDPEIRIVALEPAATMPPRTLAKFSGTEVRFLGVRDWSPDDKSLTVVLSRKDGTSQFCIVAVRDGMVRVLKSSDWRGADRVMFSADSKYIAYDLPASDAADQRDIFIMAADGSRETPAVVHSADDRVIGWSPDGQYLLFSSDRTGSNAVWAVRFSDGRVKGRPELIKSDIGTASYPLGLTKSGALFVYKNISSRDLKIAPVDLRAGKLGQTVHFTRGYVPAPQDPHWSPDGKYLVYQTRGGQDGLAVRSIETGEARRIPRTLLYARDPRWSPDGKSLIVGGRDGKGRDGVYQVDVESGRFTPIAYGSRLGAEPRWSADGTKIYYKDFGSPGRVVERDLGSGAEREVTRHPLLQNFEVSPDSQSLAIQTAIDPASQSGSLLIVSIANGSSRELLRLTAAEKFHQLHTMAWTPGSRAILIAKKTAGRSELWSVDVATGQSRKFDTDATDWAEAISIPEESNFLDGGFSLSPDGSHIAFLMGKSAAEVWALENFLPRTVVKQTAKK